MTDINTDAHAVLLRITGLDVDLVDLQSVHSRISAVDGTLTSQADVLRVHIPHAWTRTRTPGASSDQAASARA